MGQAHVLRTFDSQPAARVARGLPTALGQRQMSDQCQRCAELRTRYEIDNPAQLTKAIRIARANLAEGTLTDITHPAHSPSGQFNELHDDGPWPDYVEHYFRCVSCGRGFRLSADTYHGIGGEWEPYESAS